MPPLMRTFLSWFVGVIALIVIGIGFTVCGEVLGVPSYIDLDEPIAVMRGSGPSSYDDEVSSYQTTYGLTSGALSFVIALWVGQAIYHWEVNAGFSRKGWYSYLAWIFALTVLAALSLVFHLTFRQSQGMLVNYTRMFVELASIAGVAWASYQWYQNRIALLKPEHDA
ncbi:hypothetical protein O3301_08305 [Janthinobacterium sp. SUN211]|uniref:hypothetical protein n=1 Tax=Janthinobacterium sp. SUN211 TaxID=3014786 RepID=UPI0027134FB7|nr:hypothetical protein [Janthinobacterium sp. SUN211]MDO8048466.1 hypothetical protein [Janthinobacterium sp. SUN211]